MTTDVQNRNWADERTRLAIETEATKFVLESVGRLDLFGELCWTCDPRTADRAIRLETVFQHPDFARFPMRLSFRYRKCLRPELSIKRLLPEFREIFVGRSARDGTQRDSDLAVGLVIPWYEELVVIHNRPTFSRYRPINGLRLRTGGVLVIHWFEPLIEGIAERCRADMMEEDALMDMEEGEWSPKDWADYPCPVFE